MFEQFQTDKVKIIKKENGVTSPDIRAMVDSKGGVIHIHTQNIPDGWTIDDGDHIDRILPGNLADRYLVIDSGYKAPWQLFPERYECEVKKASSTGFVQPSSVIYNLNGNNARLYNGSVDNSSNTVSINSAELFATLTSAIKEQIPNNSELIDILKDMENYQGKPEFFKSYHAFISLAANHMTVLAPFFPVLAQMLR